MAEGNDNKTEPATEKRKADARKEGNIAVSRDVTTAALLFAGIGLMALFAGPGVHQLTDVTRCGSHDVIRPCGPCQPDDRAASFVGH